jgi:beta-N-acetylhexosaminidase
MAPGARPATLSRPILTDLLRGELGFTGLLVSDDLGMKAVADRWSIEELVVEGLLAGIDCFLIRGPVARQEAAFEALVRAAEDRSEVRSRVDESARRMAAFKARLAVGPAVLDERAPRNGLGIASHQELAASFPRVGSEAAASSQVAKT